MDPISFSIIFILVLIIAILLALPLIINIPIYRLLLVKMRGSMLILLLNPYKKIELKEAKAKSSILETKDHYYFLNVPDAVYRMWNIPVAIAYHKYGAILPPQNIIHASKMRELGFKNIGEVKLAIEQLQRRLYGDKNTPGLLAFREELNKRLKEIERDLKQIDLFTLPHSILEKIKEGHVPNELRDMLKAMSHKLPKKCEIEEIDENEWRIRGNPESFIISREGEQAKVRRDVNKAEMEAEREAVKERLEEVNREIEDTQSQLDTLENVEMEEAGVIKIQDIFNFLEKNLSTDVLFSIIERSVAEELRGMRDYFGKFQQMLPTIILLIIIFLIVYLVITHGGGETFSRIGEAATKVIPNIGAPPSP